MEGALVNTVLRMIVWPEQRLEEDGLYPGFEVSTGEVEEWRRGHWSELKAGR